MSDFAQQLTHLFVLATMASQLAIVILVSVFIFEKYAHKESKILSFVGMYALPLSFFISLSSMAISLFYSEILGFIPCGLCWLQRIFMYPQVVLIGMAIYKHDRKIADYIMSLSVIGVVIALYHHYIQMGGNTLIPCPAVSTGIDCTKRIIFEFGYITFPMMSITAFVLIFILMVIMKSRKS